jgi:hypothetical protein
MDTLNKRKAFKMKMLMERSQTFIERSVAFMQTFRNAERL